MHPFHRPGAPNTDSPSPRIPPTTGSNIRQMPERALCLAVHACRFAPGSDGELQNLETADSNPVPRYALALASPTLCRLRPRHSSRPVNDGEIPQPDTTCLRALP